MKLVLDANILFSFFRENPVRFTIMNSEHLKLELFSPKYVLEELKQNIPDLVKYSKLNPKEIEFIIERLKEFITIISSQSYKEFESSANELSPHAKDNPYFALALKLNCPIWSNELAFKKQSKIKIFSTSKLLKELKL